MNGADFHYLILYLHHINKKVFNQKYLSLIVKIDAPMYKIITVFLSLLIVSGVFAQNSSDYYSNLLLLKIKPEYKEFATANSINNTDLQEFISKLDNASLFKIFPNHQTPEGRVNDYGDSLVDLSLWYQLNYESNLPVNKIKDFLWQTGLFQNVEQRGINQLLYTPNDPYLSQQYYLRKIKAIQAWDIEKGDTNIVVGITDTGIDRLHEDLIHSIKYNYLDTVDGIDNDNDGFIDNYSGWDMGNNDNNVQCILGHGTFVSGFTSATPDNNKGIAGVGYHTKILPVRIDDSLGSLSKDYEGIVYAADHGAIIINCSWGGLYGAQFGKDVVDYATNNKGALVIAAAGNSNNENFIFPASYENVMSVAGTDSLDFRYVLSSYGSQIDISAPGEAVYSSWINNTYSTSGGTSCAAPIVAGVAALIKAHYPQLTNWQIREQLRVTADNIDTIPVNVATAGKMGAGRVNAYKALMDTLSPSIRFKNRNIVLSNDTLYIFGDFINYLQQSSSQLQAQVFGGSNYLMPINNTYNIGVLNTLSVKNNNNQAFAFKIQPNVPIGYYVDLQVNYTDTNYSGFEYFRVFLNQDNAVLDTNKITTCVNSSSTIGYTNGNKMVGNGFTYKGGKNLLAYAGLVVGNASNKVSDNVYSGNGYDDNFVAVSAAQSISPATQGDQMWRNQYNDNNAGFSKFGILVNQTSYAFNQSPLDKIVFIKYEIINQSFSNLSGIHVGLYADWDLWKYYANKADFDNTLNLSYVYSVLGGVYTGIQCLWNGNTNCYNFDNDGTNGSISLNDGFYDFEKWDALNTNRYQAGMSQSSGNDVSSLLSTGPFSILKNDTLTITFALLAGDYEQDLKLSAKAAKDWYFNTASIEKSLDNKGVNLLQNIPNPANESTEISFIISEKQNVLLEIMDSKSSIIATVENEIVPAGKHTYQVDVKNYPAGIYYYRLTCEKFSITKKMIVE